MKIVLDYGVGDNNNIVINLIDACQYYKNADMVKILLAVPNITIEKDVAINLINSYIIDVDMIEAILSDPRIHPYLSKSRAVYLACELGNYRSLKNYCHILIKMIAPC